MMELKTSQADAKEFVENQRRHLAEEICAFTPDGTVRSLPKDSGPIDFAWPNPHKVGEKALVLRSNCRMVPLNTKPDGRPGDITPTHQLSLVQADWLLLKQQGATKIHPVL